MMKIGICTGVKNMDATISAGADYIEVSKMILTAMDGKAFEKATAVAVAHPGYALRTL